MNNQNKLNSNNNYKPIKLSYYLTINNFLAFYKNSHNIKTMILIYY